jgi:hypothetical protein
MACKANNSLALTFGSNFLLEAEYTEPVVVLVRGDQGASAATFAPARQRDALLEYAPTQIGIDQAALHFGDCLAQHNIAQIGFRIQRAK